MERSAEKFRGGDEENISGLSNLDSILFPEVADVQMLKQPSKKSTTSGGDPDSFLGDHAPAALAQEACSGKKCTQEHMGNSVEDPGRGLDYLVEQHASVLCTPMAKSNGTVCGPGPTVDEKAEKSCLAFANPNSSVGDTGHYQRLQDLLIGFTTGALTLVSSADEPFFHGVAATDHYRKPCSHVGSIENSNEQESSQESSTDGFDARNDKSDNETENNLPSDAKNNLNDVESVLGDEDDDNVIEGIVGGSDEKKHDDELDLQMVDWDKFYSGGGLSNKDDSKGNEDSGGKENVNAEGSGAATNVPWKKRRREKIRGERKQFRLPRGMGAVERAIRQHCENKQGLIFEPRVGLEFDSESEAFEYYNLYSWEVGFGIRKGNLDGNKKGITTVRDIVCLRQGYDKRTKSRTKRCRCKAMIRLHRTEDDGWFISSWEKQHNHELSATDEEKKEWSSHSDIDEGTRDMIKNLRNHNIKLSKVHCILGSHYGSMNNIPFSRRSLKIICAQIAREQRDDDIKKTLDLFMQMRSEDPGFQFSVELDEYNQTKTLIWASGRSRSSYCCFGDVVTFDTTYCTNIYKMPFGLFVGVNNHFQTTIFAGVLMTDETAESFEWVFKEFLTLMGGVHPQTILTDQCRAMEIALNETMPGTAHLWCRWHVFRDARVELGPMFRKNSEFKDEFHSVITEMYTVEEFTYEWNKLLEKYKLQTHHYMVKAYEKREKWAKCYNSGTFCARMTSTQRSESANHMLKTWVPRNSSMNTFVSDLNKLLYNMYAEEERQEHETKQDMRITNLVWDVEYHARKIYTNKVYQMFSAEMAKTHRYGVPETADNMVFIVKHTKPHLVKPFRRTEFRVVKANEGGRYECECRLYEHFGLLCCHILRVFIHTGVSEIPEAHVMLRWTRRARDLIPQKLIVKCAGSSEQHAKLHIQSQIYGKALEVARKGNLDFETCDVVMRYLQKAERKLDELFHKRDEQANGGQTGKINNGKEDVGNYTSSDTEAVSGNRFGASGSCAGMSDEEVMNIKAPPRPKRKGPPVRKRYLSFLDKVEKKSRMKVQPTLANKPRTVCKTATKKNKGKALSTKVTPHCTACRMPGHNKTRCPNKASSETDELSE